MVSSVHIPSGHFNPTLVYQNSSDTSHSNIHLSKDVMSYGSRKPYADSAIVSLWMGATVLPRTAPWPVFKDSTD